MGKCVPVVNGCNSSFHCQFFDPPYKRLNLEHFFVKFEGEATPYLGDTEAQNWEGLRPEWLGLWVLGYQLVELI